MSEGDPQIIPAATLVIMREGDADAPEILMVERAAAMRFAGGALVFPGGRVDPGDVALARTIGGELEDRAARIAAIRETIEEVGLAIGVNEAGPVAPLRTALAEGVAIGEVLKADQFDLDALIPWARWLPHLGVAHRIFDTRFYLARLPADAPMARPDGGESVRLQWASAHAVLDAADRDDVRIIFPTRRNLERLAQFDRFDDAVAHARSHPVSAITPFFEDRGGEPHLCIPEGLGYPVTSQSRESALRG